MSFSSRVFVPGSPLLEEVDSVKPHARFAGMLAALSLADWRDTYATLHMWTQIVGKVRLALSPPVNHSWHSALYVTSRGLTTSVIPYRDRSFEIEFDFVGHRLLLETSEGSTKSLPLLARSVAEFYREFMALLRSNGIQVSVWKMPVEIPDPIAFDKDTVHTSYDRDAVTRFFRVLSSTNTVFQEFRSGYLGKCSPVHFFWGSFDLAVTRFRDVVPRSARAPIR